MSLCKIEYHTLSPLNRLIRKTMGDFQDLDLGPVLYNTCYGGYTLSDEFMKRLNERRAAASMEPITGYIAEYRANRNDPMIVALFQEMGEKASSGACSSIAIKWVPRILQKYVKIDEYDGRETVSIDIHGTYSAVLHEFLSEWKENPTLTVADLNGRYDKIQAIWKRYREYCLVENQRPM